VTEPSQIDYTPLRCRHCGSNRISVPARSTDKSMVTCTDCGDEIGLWGEVRVGILDVARRKPTAKTAAIVRALAQKAT
jgi:DNA-directed RNA polymerase subunit RPC12/RpoP